MCDTVKVMEERVARFADIDTRRALGFPPCKLHPSNLVIRRGIKHELSWFNNGIPYNEVYLGKMIYAYASQCGVILWRNEAHETDMRSYAYYRH